MTKEDAKRTLQDMWECLFNEMTTHTFEDLKEHGMLDNYSTAFDMAISALSEELSEDGTLTVHVSDGSKVKRVFVMGDNIFGGLYYPDSAENKGDSISKQAVKDIILGGVSTDTDADKEYVCGLIDNLPSAENKGEWKMPVQDDGMSDPIYYQVRCSKCGFDIDPQTWYEELHQFNADNFCPNCGADMRGKA